MPNARDYFGALTPETLKHLSHPPWSTFGHFGCLDTCTRPAGSQDKSAKDPNVVELSEAVVTYDMSQNLEMVSISREVLKYVMTFSSCSLPGVPFWPSPNWECSVENPEGKISGHFPETLSEQILEFVPNPAESPQIPEHYTKDLCFPPEELQSCTTLKMAGTHAYNSKHLACLFCLECSRP